MVSLANSKKTHKTIDSVDTEGRGVIYKDYLDEMRKRKGALNSNLDSHIDVNKKMVKEYLANK
jgi:hypothetical protein